MIRRRLLAGLLVAALPSGGCKERVEHADPEAIRRFEALASTSPTGSATPTAGRSSIEVAGGAAPGAPSVGRTDARASEAWSARLVDQAAALLEPMAPRVAPADGFAYASWHFDRVDKRGTADTFFRRARQCVQAATTVEERSYETSRLIAVCRGGGHDADYPALLVESDRLFDELTLGAKNVRESEIKASSAYRVFFRSLVLGGRYEEAVRRIEALHTPSVRFATADAVIRLLAERDRPSDVRRCVKVMREAVDGDSSLREPRTMRALCSAHALADDLVGAERLYRELPPPHGDEGKSTFRAADHLPAADLAAARKRLGDAAGCTQLWETDLAALVRRDPAAAIVACVECDEFDRAAAIVVGESDSASIPRLVALLCRSLIERGEVDLALRYADRFKRYVYPSSEIPAPETPARRFDDRFAALGLATVLPLLLGDEQAFSHRVDVSSDAARSRSLLRAASLLWRVRNPRYASYIPYQETTAFDIAFLSPYH